MLRLKTLLASGLLMSTVLIGCQKDEDDNAVSPAEWDYENTNWQQMGYSDCAGKVQSPVNIDSTATIKGQLPALTVNYQPMPLKILNNGHTIQVMGDGKNSIQINGATYVLKQFHFHHTSEHTVNGKSQPMELHLVNQDDQTGDIVVLSVFLANGQTNPLIQQVWENLPTAKNQEKDVNVMINPAELLPTNRSYYTYIGSLTTPPCSQGLDWIVFRKPIALSADQESVFAKLYPHNNRPVQTLNNRIVLEQD